MNDMVAQLVPAFAMALLHFLWQGAVIGLLAWLALSALRDARPQLRYAVACTALLACALLPLWHVVDAGFAAAAPLATAMADVEPAGAARVADALRFSASEWRVPHAASPWIVALWAGGAALLWLRMLMGLRWVGRQRRDSRPAGLAWQSRLDRLAACLGVVRRVSLRIVADGDSPVTAGWWHPVVLLPAAVAARMPVDLLEALLAHELAHVRRHDYLVNLLQGVVEASLFYHPVVWWLSQRIRIERELVADDLAATALGEPRRLAVALAELDRLSIRQHPPFPHAHFAQAAHGGHLMPRIRQLIQPDRRSVGAAIVLPLLGLAAAGTAFYVHARQADTPPPASVPLASPIAAAAPRPGASPAAAPVAQPVASAGAEPVAQPVAQPAKIVRVGRHDGYALVRKGKEGFLMSGDLDDADTIRTAQRAIDGDFLWFRRDGKAWIVRDADALDRARAAWQPADALDAQMRALDDKMRPNSERMRELGERMESLQAGAGAESPEMHAASARIQALAAQMQQVAQQQAALAQRMRDPESADGRRAQADIEQLDARQEALQQQMERESAIIEAVAERIEQQHAPMEALGREMEAAGKPMEQIGKQMEAVGAQIEQVAKVADGKVRAIIDDAYARGLATPAPSAH